MSKVKPRRIVVSFKNTPEDIELFNLISRYSDKSAYVKDTLRGVMKNTIAEQKTEEKPVEDNSNLNRQLLNIDGM